MNCLKDYCKDFCVQLQLNYYFANHNAKGDVNCLIDFDIDFMVSKLFVSVVASNLHQS